MALKYATVPDVQRYLRTDKNKIVLGLENSADMNDADFEAFIQDAEDNLDSELGGLTIDNNSAKFIVIRWAIVDIYRALYPMSSVNEIPQTVLGWKKDADEKLAKIIQGGGVLGGTQSLHTNSMDETWALPSEKAAKIALRTQQILAEEIGVAHPIDPLGGSYYVEWLTDRIQEQAEDYFRRIDDLGGMIAAIEQGFPQKEISAAAYRYQQEIDARQRLIVGVNEYIDEDEKIEIPILKITQEMVDRQVNNLQALRERRDKIQVEEKLNALREAAEGAENLMPYFIDCAHAYVTLGEMVGVLKEVFSEYTEPAVF